MEMTFAEAAGAPPEPKPRMTGGFRLTDASLLDAVDAAERHLELEDLRGWDPYDALCSPLFGLPVLRSNRLLRFGGQQVLKRSRWNLRPLLRIPKQVNPVSIGLYLQGQALRTAGDASSAEERRKKAEHAVRRLATTVTPGYSGSCWGYPFDWETRYGSVPATFPTVVATGMIANGLWTAHARLGLEQAGELVLSAAEFVMHDLNRIEGSDGSFCWTYAPTSGPAVLNATLKGSRLLAQAHALGGREDLLQAAARSVRFVVAHQLPSGAWPYSLSDPRADNFHTGYVLECLSAYRRHSGDSSADDALDRGWAYYRRSFFTEDLTPKYYDNHSEPLDATACAQAIITLCEFGDIHAASRVAEHSLRRLRLPDGSFAYQRRSDRWIRTPFLRWSTAWMYCALSRLARAIGQSPTLQTQRQSDEPSAAGAPERSHRGADRAYAQLSAGRGAGPDRVLGDQLGH
jgi:hypothetical protein